MSWWHDANWTSGINATGIQPVCNLELHSTSPSYIELCSPSVSLFNNLTYWQLNLGVVSGSPQWVWHTQVCPSIACFQRFYCHREKAWREVILRCEPALTGHVSTSFSVVTLTEVLPVIAVLWWIGTPHSYLTSHGAAQFLWLYTAPLC